MKSESEVFKLYETEIQAWAYLKSVGNSMYEMSFHRAWAFADVLGIPADEVTEQFRLAELVQGASE